MAAFRRAHRQRGRHLQLESECSFGVQCVVRVVSHFGLISVCGLPGSELVHEEPEL